MSASRIFDPKAAVLSYLIPGLGQVVQGRVAKGILFFVSLYALFFYGMWLGSWRNVWIPHSDKLEEVEILGFQLPSFMKDLNYRKEYLGQFWMGVAVWPSIVQYLSFDVNKDEMPLLKSYQREPKEEELHGFERESGKLWDLGWVYTVIAGALNVLVIYDALAGPMVPEEEEKKTGEKAGES